jgi:hypothetical protein
MKLRWKKDPFLTGLLLGTIILLWGLCSSGDGGCGETGWAEKNAIMKYMESNSLADLFSVWIKVRSHAQGIYTDNDGRDLTREITWCSSDKSTAMMEEKSPVTWHAGAGASLSEAGQTTGAEAGISETTADAELVAIQIAPADQRIVKGLTMQFTALGTYTDGTTQDITSSVIWNTSDGSIATVSNEDGSRGIALSLSPGTVTVTAGDPITAIHGSTKLEVTGASLASILVTPESTVIKRGATQQFTATGICTDSTTQDITSSVAWSSSDRSIAGISNEEGSRGLATSLFPGTVTITAIDTATALQCCATLEVTNAAGQPFLSVTPASARIEKGLTQQFMATATYPDNTTQDITSSVTWISSNESVARISNSEGSRGLVTSCSPGAVTITAIDPSTALQSSAKLEVIHVVLISLSVTPSISSAAKGIAQQFTAAGAYTDNTIKDITSSVIWISSNESRALISTTDGSRGVVIPLSAGAVTITAVDPATGKRCSAYLEIMEIIEHSPGSNENPTPGPTKSAIPTPIPTKSAIPTPSPTKSAIPTPSPTKSASPTPSPTKSAIPTPSPTTRETLRPTR